MEETNVNNLNGVPNFGHGMPADGVVVAGVTDVHQNEEVSTESEKSNDGVQEGEATLGEQTGAEGEVAPASDSNSPESVAEEVVPEAAPEATA